MADPRIQKLAHLLVNYSIKVKPGDKVAVRGSTASLPLVTETYREVIRAGGHPLAVWQEEQFGEIMLKHGNDAQL